ncbi:PEP-CTERM sorting domain-containing protein [Roseibacillus persicicus]|uniref:PEP-CTERM sorting domain-containing protein n=1 Tax=Roseibacillus persicicus TaxID=454148 RepID=UPI00398BAC18
MKKKPQTQSQLTAFVALCALSTLPQASGAVLIGAEIGAGNGDFNYAGGATTNPSSLTVNENIPRDRALIGTPTTGQSITISGWTFVRVSYSGGNNAFGLDGNFGFDDATFEPANTGSGQAFQNGNSNATIDLIADTINHTGGAGDAFDLTYLLGSDSAGGISTATLTLDSGLASEQAITFTTRSLAGTSRTGANTISESYISTGSYNTVDLTMRLGNSSGSTRVLVDDVRLNVIPEPSTALLGGLAFLGMLRRRR